LCYNGDMGRIMGIIMALGLLAGLAVQHPTAPGYLALARQAQARGEWRRAITWYQAASALAPGDPAPEAAIAQIRFQQGRFALAAVAISQAEAHAPNDAAVWLLAGQIAAARETQDDAARDWRQTIALAPAAPSARTAATLLAMQDLAAGQPALALRDTAGVPQPAAALRFDQAVAWLHLGNAGAALALFVTLPDDSSTAPYREIAARWQGRAADAATLGYVDLARGWPRLACAPLRAALAAQPRYGAGAAYLAWALWGSGDATGAREELALARRLSPESAATIGLAALLRAQEGDATGALRALSAWLRWHAPTSALWRIMAQVATQAGDMATVEDALWQIVISAAPADRLAALLDFARFALQTRLGRDDGRAAWAIAQLRAAAPQNADAADLAAEWAWQNGQPADALTLVQLALARVPDDVAAHADLAVWAASLGDTTEAALQADCVADLTGAGD
jgi:predicted Zn-dependent protease